MSIRVSVHLLLESDGKLLFIRRGATKFYSGWFSVVAGHLENGETADEAMRREALEEIGVSLAEPLKFAGVTQRLYDEFIYFDFFFEASIADVSAITVTEVDKITELVWLPVGELPNETVPYVADVITEWMREPHTPFNKTYKFLAGTV